MTHESLSITWRLAIGASVAVSAVIVTLIGITALAGVYTLLTG